MHAPRLPDAGDMGVIQAAGYRQVGSACACGHCYAAAHDGCGHSPAHAAMMIMNMAVVRARVRRRTQMRIVIKESRGCL